MLIAYHGQQSIKDKYLNRVRIHREADELIQGTGWDGKRGCAVGCTLEVYDHASYETELGIPRIIARLEDGIFEGLPVNIAMDWPERFLAAIEPGADLSLVMARWFVWMLTDPRDGVILLAKSDRSKLSIQRVSDLYQRRIDGHIVSDTEFEKASAAAYAASEAAYAAGAAYAASDASAAYAAYAASDASAAYAAYASASAAYASAAYAAYAAAAYADAAADAASAASAATRKKQADKLIELLVTAPQALVAA